MRLRIVCLALLLATPVAAQGTVSLPGGATALTEQHGDWSVRCQVQPEAQRIGCVMVQEQLQSETRQRLLSVEFVPTGDAVAGNLVLPFGLDLQRGVVLQVDENPPLPALPFRTCLPQGCVVQLALGPEALPVFSAGAQLGIATVSYAGAETAFAVSLSGFTGALTRMRELMN